MTDAPHTDPSPEQPRRLTRSPSDGIIGGVASGLGKYFSLDPLLFRVGFVALSFARRIGLRAYIPLLAFVPPAGSERRGRTSKAAALGGGVVIGILAIVTG